MFEAADDLRTEYAELERQLSDPSIHADLTKARKIGRRYSELTPIVRSLDAYHRLDGDLQAAKELADDDPAFAAEALTLEAERDQVADRLTTLLVPRDANDSLDAIVEIKSGEGGEESALFAADLFNMYTRYAATKGWKVEIMDAQDTDLGGYKSLTMVLRALSGQDPDDLPYRLMKFEGGVHRVQRVPVTETQGRIHTSAAGVLVTPDLDDDGAIEINDDDLRIDVYRSSGKGGQGVNTTDSAVRITHLPTGVVVTCQNERSQLQNKASAMHILRARLAAHAAEQADAEASAARKSQVRTVDRSERIRTYNYPENRIADHRIGFKA